MIISTQNRDTAILNNLVSTLAQIKIAGVANKSLALKHQATSCTVSFYVDAAKTILAFADSDTSHFSQVNGGTLYTPPDSLINASSTISTTLAQPVYFITGLFSDGTTINDCYKNSANLMFQDVKVSSETSPSFSTSSNEAFLIPTSRKTDNSTASDNWAFEVLDFELRVQIANYNWAGMSEQNRIGALNSVYNVIRSALLADRYRAKNSALYNKDIDGTFMSPIKQIPSKDILRASMRLQCAYSVTPTTF